MKSSIVTVLLAGIIAMVSCKAKHTTETKRSGLRGSYDDTLSRVLYPLDSAAADVRTFDSLSRIVFQDSVPIKGYTIRAVDLLSGLGVQPGTQPCQYDYIRVYLGYDLVKGFKLFVVPVQGADLKNGVGGMDMVLNSEGGIINANDLPREQEYVLDLNAPCPKTCADNNIFANQ